MRRARIDPGLSARVVDARTLVYTDAGEPERPPHVRAASGIACDGDTIYVIQDDTAFVAVIAGERVSSIALPHHPRVGTKPDKLDLESCLVIDGELWAFGSGSRATRERILRFRPGGDPHLRDASALYARLRDALGGRLNVEGVTRVGDALWFFHRGNCDTSDVAAFVSVKLAPMRAWLDGEAPSTDVFARGAFDLGEIAGARLGFTDVDHHDGRIFYLAAAERSADAIADGPVAGSQLGVIDLTTGAIRATQLVASDGAPIKAEGLVMTSTTRALVTVDPDDPEIPAALYQVEVSG